MSLSLVTWEALFPLENHAVTRVQMQTDILYNVVTGTLFGIVHPYLANVPSLSSWVRWMPNARSWPWLFQFFLGVLVTDLVLYGWHRLLHESGNEFLWKLHEPHHTPNRYTFLSGGRVHVIDVSVLLVGVALGQAIFGFSSDVVFWVFLYPVAIGAVHHTNADFRLGPFNWIFVGPEMHRPHHDIRAEHALNYASCFAFLDWLFGTSVPKRRGGETRFGVAGKSDEKDTVGHTFVAPFLCLTAKARAARHSSPPPSDHLSGAE
jgi:sterol desaturase/sphingolipid hydroxylase (fatty acid hydroxylase superfamily)